MGVLKEKIERLNTAFIEKHEQDHKFELLGGVVADYRDSYPDAVKILEAHLQAGRQKPDLRPGDVDHYTEIVAYEEFLALIDDIQFRDAAVRAFLFSIAQQEGEFYNSTHTLPYTYHTILVGSTVVGFGSPSLKEIVLGEWHDLIENLSTKHRALEGELKNYGFAEKECKALINDLDLLDRCRNRGPYIEATRDYYNNLAKSPSALKTKAADLMVNMRRWLMHKPYLIGKKPHLLAKYFHESGEYLTADKLGGIASDAPYSFERIRERIVDKLSTEEKAIVVKAAKQYGAEVQSRFSEMLK